MKKTLVGVMISLLFATCSAWGQGAMDYYNRGLESSMFNTKIHYFTKAIELDSGLSAAYEKRGRIYYFQENYAKMLHDFQKVTLLRPSDPEGYRMLGVAYMSLGNRDAALDKLSRAIELDPLLASAYTHRAELYRLMDLPEKAIEDASKAIELGDSQATVGRAYTVRSKVYRQLGHEELADADFDKAYDLDPKHYGYKYFTITNHLASFVNDSNYLTSKDMGRVGLVGIIVIVFVIIFKLALPSPRKGDDT